MKALILAQGFGKGLEPLAERTLEPLVEFANKPMILHQIEALKAIGVQEVLLAIGSGQEEVMTRFSNEYKAKLGMEITCLPTVTKPQETAGPLCFAKEKLEGNSPFFVLKSDIICEFPLKEMVEFHKSHGGEASIMVTSIDEPSMYGLNVMEETTVEKPIVDAGIYLLNPCFLNRTSLWNQSLEKEIFPVIEREKKLFKMVMPGFWMSTRQLSGYCTGLELYLASLRQKSPSKLAAGAHIMGNVIIDGSAKIGEDCCIGPDVVVGHGCEIETGVRLSRSTVMGGVKIKKWAYISNSIIGWNSTIGQWAHVHASILRGDTQVVDEACVIDGVDEVHS